MDICGCMFGTFFCIDFLGFSAVIHSIHMYTNSFVHKTMSPMSWREWKKPKKNMQIVVVIFAFSPIYFQRHLNIVMRSAAHVYACVDGRVKLRIFSKRLF